MQRSVRHNIIAHNLLSSFDTKTHNMAEESANNEETYGGQAELTDAELNALFEELRLDIPDPPSTFQDDWVMGELILF